jgi:PhnB protein
MSVDLSSYALESNYSQNPRRIKMPKVVPDGYHTINTSIIVDGAQEVIEFLKKTFDAKERFVMPGQPGKIAHAELEIGDSVVMISDASDQYPATRCRVYAYVADVDATYKRALAAGANGVEEPENQFWGDRNAAVVDPKGNHWAIATRVEDLSSEEIGKRAQEFLNRFAGGAAGN